MKKRVFLDTNVVLDILLERPGFQHCAKILQLYEDGAITLCQSSLSLANIAYVIRKELPRHLLSPTIQQLSAIIEIVPLDNADIQDAVLMDGPDFEDTLQLVCASRNGCDILITRNIKHFKTKKGLLEHFRMPEILTPVDYLLKYDSPEDA